MGMGLLHGVCGGGGGGYGALTWFRAGWGQ